MGCGEEFICVGTLFVLYSLEDLLRISFDIFGAGVGVGLVEELDIILDVQKSN